MRKIKKQMENETEKCDMKDICTSFNTFEIKFFTAFPPVCVIQVIISDFY